MFNEMKVDNTVTNIFQSLKRKQNHILTVKKLETEQASLLSENWQQKPLLINETKCMFAFFVTSLNHQDIITWI